MKQSLSIHSCCLCFQDGSGSDSENSDDSPEGKKRKKIRKILKDKKLSNTTLSAARTEEERRKRIAERQKMVGDRTSSE